MNAMTTRERDDQAPWPKAVALGLLMLLALLLWALPASAQRVNCGNGKWCPKDNACLLDGMCGRLIDLVPGSVRLSNGTYCDPGHREHSFRPGACVPPGYADCANGSVCPPPNARCLENNVCEGGPPATGPMCGETRCAEGRICASTGRCLNTALFKDCGNGSICSIHAACGVPKGCFIVGSERTRQLP